MLSPVLGIGFLLRGKQLSTGLEEIGRAWMASALPAGPREFNDYPDQQVQG